MTGIAISTAAAKKRLYVLRLVACLSCSISFVIIEKVFTIWHDKSSRKGGFAGRMNRIASKSGRRDGEREDRLR
jgi:hypothetical protein